MEGMQDSGNRQEFSNGAVRDTAEGKSRPDLISPFAKERLGKWLELGQRKYSAWNWAKGIPSSRHIASLERHLMKYQQGLTDEDHLAAIMCNAMFLLHNDECIKRGLMPRSLDDMPDFSSIAKPKLDIPEPDITEVVQQRVAEFVQTVEKAHEAAKDSQLKFK